MSVEITAQQIRTASATKLQKLGLRYEDGQGRIYRYAKAGATDLAAGILVVNPSLVANHTNITVAAAVAAGATEVTATLGATAATTDQYADGFLTVNNAAGKGVTYAIAGNTSASASGVITISLKEPVLVALTTSSKVTLKQSPFANVVISAVGQADLPVGVTNNAVTAGSFFWAQTGGEASVLNDASTVAKGNEITISAATAGAVGLKDAAGEAKVGIASEALVSTEYRSVFLTLN